MTYNSLSEVAARIKACNRAAIFCHARPDGDTLGSGLALLTALRNAGKTAHIVCEDPVPEKFFFLKGMDEVLTALPAGDYDLYIAVDCSDIARMGELGYIFPLSGKDTVNIDHHISNKNFAKYNFVRNCPATCELMPEVLDAAGLEITKPVADFLMLGLMTDSGSFAHSDVTANTFSVAARLRSAGADVTAIDYNMFSRQRKERALLFAQVLPTLRFFHGDKFAVITVTAAAIESAGADRSMTEGFVNYPLSIDGVEVAASLMEMKRGQYKVSLRSKGSADVNAVASTFGGGGHVLASGCMLFGDYEEVIERLAMAVFSAL